LGATFGYLIGHYASLPSALTPVNIRLHRRANLSADAAVRQGTLLRMRRLRRGAIGYSARMAPDADDPADFDRLARRYLDLWQSQLSGLAADQALTDQIARLFAAANTQMASVLQMAQGAPQHAPSASSSEIGTPTAAAAPGHGPDDVGELRK